MGVACIFPEAPHTAIQHQCNGYGNTKVYFDVVGAGNENGSYELQGLVSFGGTAATDESYENPKVMACCAPAFDDEDDLEGTQHYKACFNDFAQAGCKGIWTQLMAAKEADGVGPIKELNIQSLADWVATHQQECYEAFWVTSGAKDWVSQNVNDELELNYIWELPSSADTTNFTNIKIEIWSGFIFDVNLPPDPEDWIVCESQQDNDHVSIVEGVPSNGNVFELYYGDAALTGPGSPPLGGSSEFTSANTACSHCSIISTEETLDGVWVHSLVLDTADAVAIDAGMTTMTLDNARIALYAPVLATEVGSLYYEIGVGEAMFVVSALESGAATVETTLNSRTIELEWEPTLTSPFGTWTVSPLSFTYTDDNSAEWTLETGSLFFTP